MAMARRLAPFDTRTAFTSPTVPLVLAASDVVQIASADVVLDLGPKRTDCTLVLEIDSIEIASNDELYTFIVQGSTVEAFTAGTIRNLATIQFGATEVLPGAAADSIVGRYYVQFSTDLGPHEDLQYVRLNVIIAGSIATGIGFRAWVSIPQDTQ